jgi:hypothetical protein
MMSNTLELPTEMRCHLRGDLVVHLPLDAVEPGTGDGPALLLDASGNGNHATLEGGPKLVSDKRFGSCLQFTVGDEGLLRLRSATGIYTQGMTISVWVLLEDPNTESWLVVIRNGGGFALGIHNRKVVVGAGDVEVALARMALS